MPFRVRCPNPDCQKYNLVDDNKRGKTIRCLICRKSMPAKEYIEPGPDGTVVRQCPQCGSKLKVPADAAARRVQCPKCNNVFG